MVQWRHRQSVAAPSLWFASRKERTETPHRRHSRPARPPCAASAPINIIRPENIMTSNYSFHGNTLALHGGALHHPNICTYCFCTRQKIVLRPRQPFKGLFEYGDVRAFHKDNSCTLTCRWKCGALPQVPGWDFWHRLGKTIPEASVDETLQVISGKTRCLAGSTPCSRRHVPPNTTSVSIRSNYSNIPPWNT